ncbi:MAG: hypothetical protein C0625_09250 [Arcobacter sp.]|nr:MAG: hypothetical protein C0625_09250 [Arcobacter sp.]
MFSKESLYINAIKYKAQLKINYKKLQNNNIVETNNSTFIAKDDILGRDIAMKLIAHSSEIDNTYISTLLIQDETKLIKKNKTKLIDYAVTSLNNDYDIAISKNTLFETKNYFEKCGVDYIFSAYHILNLHIEQNHCNNNLVILLFNNQAFCLILNSKGEIVFNKRIELTPFEEIQNSEFYENEVLGQKLYDEVYALELHEAIKNTIEEFYVKSKNIFIEKVSILYNLKLISDDQIKAMSEEFMIEVTYHPISVDEELFELSKDTHTHKSFIKPRPKPKNGFKSLILILSIIAMILAIGYLFLPIEKILGKKEEIAITKNIKKVIDLPDHVEKNTEVENRVLKSLEMIPYDVVLKELLFEKNTLKIDANLLNKDTFIKVIQPELLKSYKMSDINFNDDTKSVILDAVILAEGLKNKKIVKFKDYKDIYVSNEFIPIITVTEQIKMLFPKDTIVTFKSSFESEVVTFNYLVNVVIKKPLDFFEIMNTLNNELYSINISYPLSFVKTEAGIEVEFTLQFHQPK